VAALRTHAERNLDGSGIRFELSTDSFSGRLPADMETALYRIFQEALNNVRRHSGAKQVRITLALHADSFVGEIYDDGVGFDPQVLDFNENSPRGLGLLSIRERVDQCCGQVEIISRPGRGTRILVRFPIFEVDCG
jgi:signal transduction histidine kinase